MIKNNLPENVINDASKFLQRLVGPIAEASDLLSDKIRLYRYENAIKTIKRAKEICAENKIEINEIPLAFLVPFLEASSMQE
ncbi:MAG: hypothetical protein AAF182_04520, partial [Pseudomonadota bacterium]